MDFLVLWGVTQAVGFVFKPILEELAKDAAKDYVKDFFKSCLSNVLRLPEKEPLQIATGKAITEFLKLIQQELEDADLDDTTIRQYSYFLEEFIKNKQVAEILGSAFVTDSIDTRTLKQIWKQLQSKTLPDEFNWERVTKRYLKKVKAIIQETSELRDILNSQNLQKLADTVPVQPDFDLIKHQEGIREKYGNLNLESLDTDGCAYNTLKLWNIFVPQNVRECQEYLPQVYEMPKDYLKQLKEQGELDEDVALEDLEQRHSFYSQQSTQSVLEVVNNPNYKYLVILGDPGSGKSTLQWHELTFNDEADKIRKRDRLKQAISNSSAIRELAGNPLLLTMMAILNRNQELPRDRAELYNQASRVLLHQWDIERALQDKKIDPVTIDYRDKQEMLRRVAFFMQDNEQGLSGNLISRENLERILQEYLQENTINDARTIARALIEQLRSRNFILCYVGSDFYAFVHRTFLEYFCAWEFVWQFEKERTLSEEELVQVYAAHWREEAWHEVLRLIAGMLDPKFIGKVLEYLMAQDGEANQFINLFLAAECLAEVRNRHPVAKIANELFTTIEGLIYDNSIDFINTDGKTVGLTVTCIKAVETVANTWKEHPQTLTWLKIRAATDENSFVKCAAVNALAKHYKDDPETLIWLKTRATTDEDWRVRRIAVLALAQYYKDHPELFELFCDRAVNDPFERKKQWHNNPRQTALEAILKNYPNHPKTLPLLRDRAINDPDEKLREWANEQLEKFENRGV